MNKTNYREAKDRS